MAPAIFAAIAITVILLVIYAVRHHNASQQRRREILQNLGFVPSATLPAAHQEAFHLLHAPKAKADQVPFEDCFHRRVQGADIYWLHTHSDSDHLPAEAQLSSGFTVYVPHTALPPVTVFCTQDSQSLTHKTLAATIQAALRKREEQVLPPDALPGATADFLQRSLVLARSPQEAQRVLLPAVQQALLSYPYLLFESRGHAFCVCRPAQAGYASSDAETWRALYDAARKISAALPGLRV